MLINGMTNFSFYKLRRGIERFRLSRNRKTREKHFVDMMKRKELSRNNDNIKTFRSNFKAKTSSLRILSSSFFSLSLQCINKSLIAAFRSQLRHIIYLKTCKTFYVLFLWPRRKSEEKDFSILPLLFVLLSTEAHDVKLKSLTSKGERSKIAEEVE